MCYLFKKAHESNLPVPANLIGGDNNFIRYSDFDYLYFGQQDKRNLWNTVFDIEKFENEELQLDFGLKTDGHMVSLLFEKTTLNFVPQNKRDLQIQKTRKNLTNWVKGISSL
jgi:hypothetical protein